MRDLVVIEAYWNARKSSEKHEWAVVIAADAARQQFPQLPTSPTEVKRILARLQPAGCDEVYGVTPRCEGEFKATLLQYPVGSYPRKLAEKKISRVFTITAAPRPEVQRINARSILNPSLLRSY